MRSGIEITVTPEDHRRLEAIARDRNTAQKDVARAKVILAICQAASGLTDCFAPFLATQQQHAVVIKIHGHDVNA